MSAQLRPLLIANLKMFWRSLDTVWVAIVSPMLLLGIVGLARHLQFAFTHSTGGVAFLSFSATGFAAFLGAHLNQDGIVGAASGYRAQGVLKRIAVTPVSARTFIAGQVLIRLAVALLQTVVLVGFAIVLGASIAYTIDLAWILPVAATALLTGTGFGFAIAGATRSPEAANQLNIALFTPVFLLAGVQYPLQGLPGVLPNVAEYVVPFAAPVQAFREAVAGQLAGDFPRLLALSLAWLTVALVLAVRSYRFGEDS